MAKRKKHASSRKKKIKKKEFSFFKFIFSLKAEIITILCLIIGIRIIVSLGTKKEIVDELNESVLKVSSDQHALWKKQYPSGYKIIAIAKKQIIQTDQDTLPDDLKIDWNNVVVSVIPPNPLNQTEEKIKIDVPIISYAPVNVYGLTVSAIFSRNQREKVGLAKFGWHNLIAEVIGESDDEILCLIGFQ